MRLVLLLAVVAAEDRFLRRSGRSGIKPNGFAAAGCWGVASVTGKVKYEGSRAVDADTCFNFCADRAAVLEGQPRYFALQGGTCWCAEGYQGTDAGKSCEEACPPGVTGCGIPKDVDKAAMYLMHHCVRNEEDAAAVATENEAMMAAKAQAVLDRFMESRQGQSCSTEPQVSVNGEKTMVGSVDDCKVACGHEVTCAMFTYDEAMTLCSFGDSMEDNAKEGSKLSCWFKGPPAPPRAPPAI